jgi:hypothetical protein
LHQLQDTIASNRSYYTSDSQPYDPAPLAKVTVNIQKLKEDKFVRMNLTTSPYTKGQTLASEIRTMIETNVSATTFKNTLKGFALVADANSGGNVVGFVDDISTGLLVHYTVKSKEAEGVPDKNTPKTFPLYTGLHYHNISVDRTGTPLAGFNTFWQPIPTTSTQGNALLQAGSAIYTRLSFPTLKNLRKLGNVVINKAVLTMKASQNSAQTMSAPPYVFLYEAGSNGKLAYQTLNGFKQPVRVTLDGTSQTFLAYNNRDEQYEIALSRYAQFVMVGEETNPYIMLIPANNSFKVDRAMLGHSKDNIPNKMRLKVYYTIFK